MQAVLRGFSATGPDSALASTDEACAKGIDWVCMIDRIESAPGNGAVKVMLAPDSKWAAINRISSDYYQVGRRVAINVYNFAGADRDHITLQRVDVYESDGTTAYLSPLGFPN
jgi:hypothetical protein